MKKFFVTLLAVVIVAAGWYLLSPIFIVKVKDEPMPPSAAVTSRADFKPQAHEVSGTAVLLKNPDGSKTLRFENFSTVNGPNLHVYLASDLSASDYIDLGPITATKGNANYSVPAGTDLNKYRLALVWCVPFKVLFSYAVLSGS